VLGTHPGDGRRGFSASSRIRRDAAAAGGPPPGARGTPGAEAILTDARRGIAPESRRRKQSGHSYADACEAYLRYGIRCRRQSRFGAHSTLGTSLNVKEVATEVPRYQAFS
jgi:hypothetical protein